MYQLAVTCCGYWGVVDWELPVVNIFTPKVDLAHLIPFFFSIDVSHYILHKLKLILPSVNSNQKRFPR